jgi:hypothetical protein
MKTTPSWEPGPAHPRQTMALLVIASPELFCSFCAVIARLPGSSCLRGSRGYDKSDAHAWNECTSIVDTLHEWRPAKCLVIKMGEGQAGYGRA